MTSNSNDQMSADGGLPYLSWNLDAAAFEKHETDMLQALGAALVSCWFELPRDVQETIFNGAIPQTTTDANEIKGKLARFLHNHAE